VKKEGCPHYSIDRRRLGAWKAVVFGALHVESALTMVLRAGLLALRVWLQRRQWLC